jgi:bifunctional lysine-specific demethylase and histidyl-hydroxylase NO66
VHYVTNSSDHVTNQQQHKHRYDQIFAVSDLRDMIQNHTLYYGTDLNVTRYEKSNDGVYRRITLDKKKKTNGSDDYVYETVKSNEVWDLYNNQKCTIRLLCPQQYNDTIHALLSLLEHEFHCMVGANIYCTPPNSAQGFAPHYDDIDAYIVQLEGYKRWKVYKPINSNERLPRTSSRDYATQDLMHIEPVMDIVLGPGDLLYMPRGWIHQACTIPISNKSANDDMNQQHSLHLTISTMQQWAWADYMEILLPEALQSTIQSSTTTLLREGLPNGFLQYMGAMYDNRTELLPEILQAKLKAESSINDDENNGGSSKPKNAISKAGSEDSTLDEDDESELLQQQQQRQILQEEFRTQTKRRLMRVVKEAMTMIDAACDQMGKRFLSERLPPALTESERNITNASNPVAQMHHKLTADTLCQIVRPGIARLVLEDEMAIVYHCNDNSRVYQEHPISPLEFEMDDAPSIEQLLTTTPPHWIAIEDLIHDTIEDKVGIAQALYDEGILAIRR